MTINPAEIKVENTLPQDKADTNPVQEKVDTNVTQQAQATPKEGEAPPEDVNWKAFRDGRKKDIAERQAAQKRAAEKEAEAEALKAAMEAILNRSPTNSVDSGRRSEQKYDAYPEEETEDERIDKKVEAKLAQREAAYEKARIDREQRELPQRLLQAFPDYYQVVNEENGAYLEYHHPELYRSLLRQPENFETLSDTYKLVKKLLPNTATSKKDAARAEANFSKPKSISSTGLTQSGEGSSRSSMAEIEARRNARYAEMKKIINGIS